MGTVGDAGVFALSLQTKQRIDAFRGLVNALPVKVAERKHDLIFVAQNQDVESSFDDSRLSMVKSLSRSVKKLTIPFIWLGKGVWQWAVMLDLGDQYHNI
jgi:hypothetical protein